MHRRLFRWAVDAMSEEAKFQNALPSMLGSLYNLRNNGFSPPAIIDIGAYVGDWSQAAATIWPSAAYHLIEAQPDKAPRLMKLARDLSSGSHFYSALLAAESGIETDFYTMETGSSILAERTTFARSVQKLKTQTLDIVLEKAGLPQGCLLKLDVQGYELEVLKGGAQVLKRSDVLLAEVSLLEYNQGAPLFAEVLAFLHERGFLPYDICSLTRRESDLALFQADVIFVRQGHALRQHKRFWKREA